MAADFAILEMELKNQVVDLKRSLHMRQVHELARKHYGLYENVVQKRLIRHLEKKVAELSPTVSMMYSFRCALKDDEIRSYLVYLLQLKDNFAREVATKLEMIQQRDSQVKVMFRKLCALTNEYAKRQKSTLPKPVEFIRLDSMSSRMNQVQKRICIVRNENKDMREDILNMRIFHRQYRKLELKFRGRIGNMKDDARAYLERAVNTYEEKEDFENKIKHLQERRSQDLRKASINQNALDLCLEKTRKNEEFLALQAKERIDARIARTSEMMDKGETGLEPKVEELQNLHGSIVEAAEEDTPEKMADAFKMMLDQKGSMFAYLDEMNEEMNHLQKEIEDLRKNNSHLLQNMSEGKRRLKWEIEEQQNSVEEKKTEAEQAEDKVKEARQELDSYLEHVRALYQNYYKDEPTSLEELNDYNAIEYVQSIEKRVLEYLMFIEYQRMKEADEKEIEITIGEPEEAHGIDEPTMVDSSEILQPRLLKSECELPALSDLEEELNLLSFEELKKTAVDVLSDLESVGSNKDETDSMSPREKKR